VSVLALLGLVLAWGSLAFGAVYQWAYRPLLPVALLAGIVAAAQPAVQWWPRRIIVASTVCVAAIATQLLPFDAALLQQLSPKTHDVLMQLDLGYAMSISETQDARHALSLSPPLTIIGMMFFISASVLSIGVARWLTRRRLRRVAVMVAILGGTVALVGIVQQAITPDLMYGF
jgi:hypothetical protein